LEARNLAGLEFLEGIPGTLGGALRMNAGAWGEDVARFVSWVRCLEMDGTPCTLYTSQLGAQYRGCRALEGRIVLEAALNLRRDKAADIRLRRRRFAEQRRWLRGLRCAGSIFKNPENESAGRLIEQAGLKGMRVGGARIFEGHANVIVTEFEACASDVRTLLELVRGEVQEQTGIMLEPEIVFLE
ncbi:MAG: UDP-N-acetylenolpyruvoylglucosamine reductase, partial [Kiritimatiellae bacterium]|nr:UDP-N-acetylenolpyruvoylglucosamine reductase [Kiritimatiellia bacterium]